MFLGGNLFSGRLTTPKFNMELENDAFQEESPLPGADFQVNHVNFQGCMLFPSSPRNSSLQETPSLGGSRRFSSP